MLSGPEQLKWRDALFNAFSEQELKDLFLYRLNDQVSRYTSAYKSWETQVGDLVTAYSQRDLEDQLIAKAIEARPRNSALLRLASSKQVASAPDDTALERIIHDTNSFLDLGKWLAMAGHLQACVCRIEIGTLSGGTVFGTGFLIAADLVMTNWHVVHCIQAHEDRESPYDGPRGSAASAICRFDYRVLSTGTTNVGVAVPFAADWRVLLSPNNPAGQEPEKDQLDCAIVRLQKAVGSLVLGDNPGAPGDARGWIKLASAVTSDFRSGTPLFIIQHPDAQPIKLALSTNSVQSVNANRTRVRYSTNTMGGSSGAPCFDQNWNLSAIHHSGDPNFNVGHRAAYNEGIPIDSIVTLMLSRGLSAIVNG